MNSEAEMWVNLINALNWCNNHRIKRCRGSQGVWEAYIIVSDSFNKRGALFRVFIKYKSFDLTTAYYNSEKHFGVTPLLGHSRYQNFLDIEYREPPIKYSTKKLFFRDVWTKTTFTKDELEEALLSFFLTLDS